MKRILIIFAGTALLTACSEGSNTETQAASVAGVESVEVEAVVANKVLSMEIDGMMCKMNCGGAIRKALKETGAVTEVEFDFDEKRTTNYALVSFDSELISPDKMVEIVSELYDHQYTVGETSVEEISQATDIKQEASTEGEDAVVEVSSTSFVELPNLLDLLSGLFTL